MPPAEDWLQRARARQARALSVNTRTRLREERSSGSRALQGRDTSRNAQHFAAAAKALYHPSVHAHARVKRAHLPQLLMYTHMADTSARDGRAVSRACGLNTSGAIVSLK